MDDAAAEARSEAFALRETKVQAEKSMRELARWKKELAALLDQTRKAAALSAAEEEEARKADNLPI